MKIIGISASPRDDSNSKLALEKALEAASAKGAETQIFELNKLNITACQGDNYCKAHEGKCAIDDDMQEIYKAIEEADGLILAAPIYFFDLNATAKLFIDRLYSYYLFPFAETYGTKKFSMIISQGESDENAFKIPVETQAKSFDVLGFDVKDIAYLIDNNVPGSVLEKEDQIEKAIELGENIVL